MCQPAGARHGAKGKFPLRLWSCPGTAGRNISHGWTGKPATYPADLAAATKDVFIFRGRCWICLIFLFFSPHTVREDYGLHVSFSWKCGWLCICVSFHAPYCTGQNFRNYAIQLLSLQLLLWHHSKSTAVHFRDYSSIQQIACTVAPSGTKIFTHCMQNATENLPTSPCSNFYLHFPLGN